MSLIRIFAIQQCVAAFAALALCSEAAAAPKLFSATSAWNVSIPSSGATWSSSQATPNVVAGLDTWDSGNTWTNPFYVASNTTPCLQPLLYNSNAWYKVYTGEWLRWGNSSAVEQAILASSSAEFPYTGNVFSSIATTSWVLPPSYNKTMNPVSSPARFCFSADMIPAPGPDGDRAVLQPNNLVLETYSTIVLSSGQVVALSYAVTDPSSRGDGWQNGQSASMLPHYAGRIYDDEIKTGINHAISISVPPKFLAAQIAYPAYAFDRDAMRSNPPYSGVLPMGSRLALPPSVTNASLRLSTPEGVAIANAARRFGFIIIDRGGGGVTLCVNPKGAALNSTLHAWNWGLQSDLNAIFAKVRRVQFPIATNP
ncbi:hypothetical protein [Methylocapsa palsarum]|uniref:Uncharacterized protein n=1 Tax=Methylocapsa palsarum TaxID=1612308 RepID=A0A1I3X4Y4_9HYPH|nr:hypothetical protein [Methylocapsa palsarum]SFK14653.1 hypothetical protein SAMN05444581_102362 [Methylocapsa palsarum]